MTVPVLQDEVNPCGIYSITNTVNGKVYIGQSVNIKKRWVRHLWELNQGVHGNKNLQRAFDLDGKEAFVITQIEQVERDKEKLFERENYWIEKMNSILNGYNLFIAKPSPMGFRHSEESKKAMRKPKSAETIEKIRTALTGKKASPETRAKQRALRLGKKRPHTEATKEKLRGVRKPIGPMSEAQRKAISETLKGRQKSEAHQAAINESRRRKFEEKKNGNATNI